MSGLKKICAVVTAVLIMLPALCLADTATMSSVDQVLGALAEVVKDRAKEVATRTIMNSLVSKLCSSATVTIPIYSLEKQELIENRRLYLGHSEECNTDPHACSDVLFQQTCRIHDLDPDVQLTDPYFLKTLSRDTIGFSIRLSAFKLKSAEFDELNLAPFAQFIHTSMEHMTKGRTDIASFSKDIDELVESISRYDQTYEKLRGEIVSKTSATAFHASLTNSIDSLLETHLSVTILDTVITTTPATLNTQNWSFDDLFGKNDKRGPLSAFLYKACSFDSVHDDPGGKKLKVCRLAQLQFRLNGMLSALTTTTNNEDAKKNIRRLLYTINDHAIYDDALQLASSESRSSFKEMQEKTTAVLRSKLQSGWVSRAAINDILRLTAAIGQALAYEQEDAIAWIKQFQKDLNAKSQSGLHAVYDLQSLMTTTSLSWFKRTTWPPYTRRMRDSVEQIIVTPQNYLYVWETNNQSVQFIMDLARSLSNDMALVTSDFDKNRSFSSMVNQLMTLMTHIAAMKKGAQDNAGKALSDIDSQLEVFAEVLTTFNRIVDHGRDREWVAIGLDISEQLAKKQAVNEEAQRGLRFSRTLLSMYEAGSVEDAKAILASTLENAASRGQRYGKGLTIDLTALVGARIGEVEQKWNSISTPNISRDTGYGLFAPFGVQFANSHYGMMLYPVDLGAYVSGSNADESSDIKVQSALHAGLALYFWRGKDVPVVVGASVDYKPRFGSDDSRETRYSAFIALELPLFIIH